MLEGRIKTIDLTRRNAVIITDDDREYTVFIPDDVIIEVSEPETMGTMGGELEDLEIGYHVMLEVRDHQPDGSCTCTSLESIS